MDRDSKIQMLTADIERRLRPVCERWPAEQFAALVQNVVRVKVKYDLPKDHQPGVRGSSEDDCAA